MKVTIRLPETEEGKKELETKLAKAHYQLIKSYIELLPLSDTTKINILENIREVDSID